MRHKTIKNRAISRVHFRFMRYATLALAFIVLAPQIGLGQGQQLPLGVTPDQLQQLQGARIPGAQPAVPELPSTSFLLPERVPMASQVPSRLEAILSQRAGVQLRLFGYDVLGTGRAVTVSQSGAVQDDYVLGPGDEIVVSLRGTENSEARVLVGRDGQVLLPRLNPISATGRSFGSFRQDVEAAVSRSYVATGAFVSVGRVRQISVLVSGEVNVPGQRNISGLTSLTDVLLLSGGVKKGGSLRNVHIERGGRRYMIDLYSVLAGIGRASNMRLADGDRIVVPLLGPTVAVAGLVRRPGIYELPARQSAISVSALLSLAGGQEVRGSYRMSILQILADGRGSLNAVAGESGSVRDSEILFVQLGADLMVNQATLGGASGLAGVGPVASGAKLSEWLRQPGALGKTPYMLFGIMVRKDSRTLSRRLVAFTPAALLSGKEDLALQGDDLIRPLSESEAQLLMYVARIYTLRLAQAQSSSRNPRSQVTGPVSQAFAYEPGLENSATVDLASVPADILRREITAVLDIGLPGSDYERRRTVAEEVRQRALVLQAERQALPANQGQNQSSAQGPFFSQRQMPQQVETGQQLGTQSVLGVPPNLLPMEEYARLSNPETEIDPNTGARRIAPNSDPLAPNFMEQTADPGQFVLNREVQTFGQFARQLDIEPLVLMSFLIDNRIRLDGAVQGPGNYLIGPSVTVTDLLQAAGGALNWADQSNIELLSTVTEGQTGRSVTHRSLLQSATLASHVLRPRDQIRFGQVFADVGLGAVSIQGEVRSPGTFSIIRGDRLSDVLARAGGVTNTAYPVGTIFLRRSVADAEREGYMRAASDVQNQLISAMTRVGNDKIDPTTFASMQSFVAELRNQRAVGRMAVTADPSLLAANPSLDPLMEAGDFIYVPQRTNTVTVLGQVMNPGSHLYQANMTVRDYIERSGGYAALADASETFVVLPDGSARRIERSWLSFDARTALPPGSTVVVPRDVTPLDLRQSIIDIAQILSQLAVSIASVAVISKQ